MSSTKLCRESDVYKLKILYLNNKIDQIINELDFLENAGYYENEDKGLTIKNFLKILNSNELKEYYDEYVNEYFDFLDYFDKKF